MPDYSAQATRVAAQIEKYGAPAQLQRAAAGDYDTKTGEVDDNGTQVFNTTAVRDAFKRSDIDGTSVLATDVRLYLSPSLATEPKPGDVIVFDGETYSVVNVRPTKPGTVVLLYDVQCRYA